MLRRINTRTAFRERLVAFWADHFTAVGKGGLLRAAAPLYVEEALRSHIAGKFTDLLIFAVTHPLMLHYLDQNTSAGPNSPLAQRRNGPIGLNENLARGVLELHTLGVEGPYDQRDVHELAKLLTGLAATRNYSFKFRQNMTEPGPKTVLGRTYGTEEGMRAIRKVLNDLALHPALASLMPLWHAQELGFVHAVSTPYRHKRSHFDGQDLLEAGTDALAGGVRDGWLNRMLQEVPDIRADTAHAIGNSDIRVLDAAAPVADWAPEANLGLSPQALRLAELVIEDDPALHAALAEAEMLSVTASGQSPQGRAHNKIAQFAASRLRGDARVAAFSLGGWDTHRRQDRALPRSLTALADTLLTLKSGLGPVWDKTAVVAMTEFGRTARENGTGGTDHGTAGLMIMAGGAVRGGRVYGRWPGLGSADLYDERDLMPTDDVRAPVAWIMRGMAGLSPATFEARVFPGLEMGSGANLLR